MLFTAGSDEFTVDLFRNEHLEEVVKLTRIEFSHKNPLWANF